MRNLIIAALGMLLLVSAAAAAQDIDGNSITATTNQETIGSCIIGASAIQATVLDTNLLGCDNVVDQNMFLQANDNSIIGALPEIEEADTDGDGEMEIVDEENAFDFTQQGQMVFNATGSDNDGTQDIDLYANDNCLTSSMVSQMGVQTADVFGCDNDVFQDTDAYLGLTPEVLGSEGNDFTFGSAFQGSVLDVCAEGSDNDVDQHALQSIFDTCLTGTALPEEENETGEGFATLSQQAMLTENLLGCGNTNDGGLGDDFAQNSRQIIDDSDFTAGASGVQVVKLNEQVTGSDNLVDQFGDELIDDGCVIAGGAIGQSIIANFVALGCDNLADQDATLINVDNDVIGGNMLQTTQINNNVMG